MRRLIITVKFITIAGLLSYSALARSVHPVQAPRLEYFPSLPKAIDSCSGVYTYDSVPLNSEKYIFVDNLRNLAFVNVNGNEIELKKIKDLVFPGGKKIRAVYEGSGYKVILIVSQIRQAGVKAANLVGTLQVNFGHSSLEFKIHGLAGCLTSGAHNYTANTVCHLDPTGIWASDADRVHLELAPGNFTPEIRSQAAKNPS